MKIFSPFFTEGFIFVLFSAREKDNPLKQTKLLDFDLINQCIPKVKGSDTLTYTLFL